MVFLQTANDLLSTKAFYILTRMEYCHKIDEMICSSRDTISSSSNLFWVDRIRYRFFKKPLYRTLYRVFLTLLHDFFGFFFFDRPFHSSPLDPHLIQIFKKKLSPKVFSFFLAFPEKDLGSRIGMKKRKNKKIDGENESMLYA